MKRLTAPGFKPNPLAPDHTDDALPVRPLSAAIAGPRPLLAQVGVATPQGTVFGRLHPRLGAPGVECTLWRTRKGEPGAVPVDTRVFLDEPTALAHIRQFCDEQAAMGQVERVADGLAMLRALDGSISRRVRAVSRRSASQPEPALF